jgi:D-aminopeptidase
VAPWRWTALEVEPMQGDVFRMHVPGTLFRGWLDMRVLREDRRVVRLEASGGRVKRVRYDRLAGPG